MNPLHFPATLCNDWIGPVTVDTVRPVIPVAQLASWRDMAARLREIDEQFAQAEFDQERVDELRRAIAEGRFVVDPAGIAAGMLRSLVPTRRKN